jgi:hypothetical protein
MVGFLKDSWLGKVSIDVDEKRLAVGLPKDATMIQNAEFPTILVCGDVSTAKSSTLNRLIGINCLPVGKNIKTRRPLVIHLRYQEDESKIPIMRLNLPNKKNLETRDATTILQALETDFEEIKSSQLGIDKTEGYLWIWSSTVPNVNLIDLPGLMHVADLVEPGGLPSLIKELVLMYLQKPHCIVLAIMDANTFERQSPTAGLLRQTKPKNVIKVLTKPDLAVRMDDYDNMGEFVQRLMGIDVLIDSTYTVSIKSNYTQEGFDGTTDNEMKFFQDHLGLERFTLLKSKLGIHSLLIRISNLSETTTRKNWTLIESKRYQIECDNYEKQLKSLGPILDSKQIASEITSRLFQIPKTQAIVLYPFCKLEELMSIAWDDSQYPVPGSSIFEFWHPSDSPTLPIVKFLHRFEYYLLREIDTIFSNTEHQLFRFKKFQTELKLTLSQRFKEQQVGFEAQWVRSECHLWNSRDVDSAFTDENWSRAAKCCLVQKVLAKLVNRNNHQFTSLESVMQSFFSQFSNEEDLETIRIRTDISKKLDAIQGILKLL